MSSSKEMSSGAQESILFTPEQQQLYEKPFQEGYDLRDPEYKEWLRITHPVETVSDPRSDSSLISKSSNSTHNQCSGTSTTSSNSVRGSRKYRQCICSKVDACSPTT